MTHTDFISADEVISDVTTKANDEEFVEFTPGWYMSQVQQALTELGYDTMFEERTWEADIPECLEIKLPAGMFNIRDAHVFSGDRCGTHSMQRLNWARNYTRANRAMFKEQRGTQRDPIMEDAVHWTTAMQVLAYNTMNGMLMLTDACRAYEKVWLKYNGIGVDFGSAPAIPMHLRQAVKDWVSFEALSVLANRRKTREDRDAVRAAEMSLRGDGSNARPGSWLVARRRTQSMDTKARKDLRIYLSNLSGAPRV